jgi:hypothetical protein
MELLLPLPIPKLLQLLFQIPPLSQSSPVQLSLVIPTYNEASSIGSLVRQLCAHLDTILTGGL